VEMALPSSFVNVTLSFWTNDNGFAIAPPESHPNDVADSLSNHSSSSASSSSSSVRKGDDSRLPSAHALTLPQDEKEVSKDSKNSINTFVQHLISDLWKKGESKSIENDSTFSHSTDIVGNVSRFAKNLIDNSTNQANDTFRCLPSDTGSNECLWASYNYTSNATDVLDDSKPEKVYWALFLVILPILALFGNILVILRYNQYLFFTFFLFSFKCPIFSFSFSFIFSSILAFILSFSL
jgi:hypothetical protein